MLTNLYTNEYDHDLLKALRVATRHALLEQLEHILQYLHTRVKQLDTLRDLKVRPRGSVERL